MSLHSQCLPGEPPTSVTGVRPTTHEQDASLDTIQTQLVGIFCWRNLVWHRVSPQPRTFRGCMFMLVIPQEQRVVFFVALKSVGCDSCESIFVTPTARCGHQIERGAGARRGLDCNRRLRIPCRDPVRGSSVELELGRPGTLHSPLGLTCPPSSQVCVQGRELMSPINSVGTRYPLRARLCAGAQEHLEEGDAVPASSSLVG